MHPHGLGATYCNVFCMDVSGGNDNNNNNNSNNNNGTMTDSSGGIQMAVLDQFEMACNLAKANQVTDGPDWQCQEGWDMLSAMVANVEGTILPFVIVSNAITLFVIVIIIAMTAGLLHEPSAMVAKIEDVMNENNSV